LAIEPQPAPGRSGRRFLASLLHYRDPGRVLIAVLALVVVAAAAGATGYLARPQRAASLPPAPAPAAPAIVRGIVTAASPDSLTLQTDSGPLTVRLSTTTSVEAVRRASLVDVRPGDWVNVGGVHHDQTFYAITAVVVIPAADLAEGR
jgi:hypothetical protein